MALVVSLVHIRLCTIEDKPLDSWTRESVKIEKPLSFMGILCHLKGFVFQFGQIKSTIRN